MKATKSDLYLEEHLANTDFTERFEAAGAAWDVALQIAALREKAGLFIMPRGKDWVTICAKLAS